MLKADLSVKVRECVTSLCFLRWFMSNAPVFGHHVLVLEDETVESQREERREKERKNERTKEELLGGTGGKKEKNVDKRGRDD